MSLAVRSHEYGDGDDIGQIGRPVVGAGKILLVPTARAMASENSQFSRIALPMEGYQSLMMSFSTSFAGEQLRMTGRAGQDVQLADAMHHARQHRFVGIDPGARPREHIGERRHVRCCAPRDRSDAAPDPPACWPCGFDSSRRKSTALRTMLWPMRAMAVRKSVTFLPLRLMAAEFAIRSSRAASAGSDPTTRTICSTGVLGSDKIRLTCSAISGNDGRSTWPPRQLLGQAADEIKGDVGW